VLRIMVQEELFPTTEQTAAVDLAQSFREIFKCMYSPSVPLCAMAGSFDSRLQMAIRSPKDSSSGYQSKQPDASQGR
jgi:hypothetical protein